LRRKITDLGSQSSISNVMRSSIFEEKGKQLSLAEEEES